MTSTSDEQATQVPPTAAQLPVLVQEDGSSFESGIMLVQPTPTSGHREDGVAQVVDPG